jgi:hypothetical protein
VAWVLLADFSQIYSENWEQKANKDVKSMHLCQKRSTFKVKAEKIMVSEEICAIKTKPSILYQNNRKDNLSLHVRHQQDPTHHMTKGIKLKFI